MKILIVTSTIFVIFAGEFVSSQIITSNGSTLPPWQGLLNFLVTKINNTAAVCATPCENGLVCRTRDVGFSLQCSG